MKLEDEIVQRKFQTESHKLGVNIIYTFNWLNAFQTSLLRKYDLTPQQYNVLRILRGQHPGIANIKLIKERMLDKMSDASRIVEKLRGKNFLRREICPEDRRACNVTITDKGLSLLSEIDKEDVTFEKLFKHLKPEDVKKLNDLLDELRG
ncbi:MAG: MarR family transcriptional regulator [Bacteroidetes bacterium]|nr:MAG: MarR family transcriptional regulator [Bacteroidota bacterium]